MKFLITVQKTSGLYSQNRDEEIWHDKNEVDG
jgi:hypothetical protein